jgi:hypothetical protein
MRAAACPPHSLPISSCTLQASVARCRLLRSEARPTHAAPAARCSLLHVTTQHKVKTKLKPRSPCRAAHVSLCVWQRCATPATFENMDYEEYERKRKRRRKKRRMRPSRQQTLQASAASSTRTHSACFFWREISRADVSFQLLRGSEPAPSSSCRQSAWPVKVAM